MSGRQRQIRELIAREKLPPEFGAIVARYYIPLAESLVRRRQGNDGDPLIVGINGAQGTGKSTLTAFLSMMLSCWHGLPTATFSLDDIYLTRRQRGELAKQVHPLLQVRGVPGTHDIALGVDVIERLCGATASDRIPLPAFDKAVDDRKPEAVWPVFQGRPEIIIVEGWCLGARPESEAELMEPINELERTEDSDGYWRRYVNDQLISVYPALFDRIGFLAMIAAPDFRQVSEWRRLQEDKLREKCEREGLDSSAVMSDAGVGRFIQHYERVTRHCLREMPGRVDCLLRMAADHGITSATGLNLESTLDR